MSTEPLTAADMEVLAFERERFSSTGRKETAILQRFNDTPARYYQCLHAVLAKPEALAYDAPTVTRLQRLRDARRAQRTGQTGDAR